MRRFNTFFKYKGYEIDDEMDVNDRINQVFSNEPSAIHITRFDVL